MDHGAAVFVRVGWMETYQGSRTEEQPTGGGKNNRTSLGGGERDNFLPENAGTLHGYFAVGSGRQNINLSRVGGQCVPRTIETLSSVLVVFVATDPDRRGSFIVGWYRDATLYRSEHLYAGNRHERVEAEAAQAVLIPIEHRHQRIRKPERMASAEWVNPISFTCSNQMERDAACLG